MTSNILDNIGSCAPLMAIPEANKCITNGESGYIPKPLTLLNDLRFLVMKTKVTGQKR
jgi:hypothetical protein